MTVMAPLIGVTLRGLLGRRRTILLALLAGLPVLIALLIRISGGRPDADRILDTLVVRTVMPLVALILGTAAIGSEIDDGTAVYLLIKPISRWRVAASKIAVAAGLTAAMVVPAVILTGLLLGSRSGDTTTTVVAYAIACLVGGSAYAAAFVALSLFTTRALLLGLAYVLIWEGVLSGLLEGTKFLSIRQATLGLAAAQGVDVPNDPLAPVVSVVVIVVVLVGAFSLASWKLARFEIRGGD
jgi:ABC-2 type transport system permease protein